MNDQATHPPTQGSPPSRGKGFLAVCIIGGLVGLLVVAYGIGYVLLFYVFVTVDDSTYRVLPVGIERVEIRTPDLVNAATDYWIAGRIVTLYFPFMEVDGNGCRRRSTWLEADTPFSQRVREVVGPHYDLAVYEAWCDEGEINVLISDGSSSITNMVWIESSGIYWAKEP